MGDDDSSDGDNEADDDVKKKIKALKKVEKILQKELEARRKKRERVDSSDAESSNDEKQTKKKKKAKSVVQHRKVKGHFLDQQFQDLVRQTCECALHLVKTRLDLVNRIVDNIFHECFNHRCRAGNGIDNFVKVGNRHDKRTEHRQQQHQGIDTNVHCQRLTEWLKKLV